MGEVPVGSMKKCSVSECVCKHKQMPLTEILYGEEHPKHFRHTKTPDFYEQAFPVHEHIAFPSLKRISRKYPKVYKYVKAQKEKTNS